MPRYRTATRAVTIPEAEARNLVEEHAPES